MTCLLGVELNLPNHGIHRIKAQFIAQFFVKTDIDGFAVSITLPVKEMNLQQQSTVVVGTAATAEVRVFDTGRFGGTADDQLVYRGSGEEFLTGGAGNDTFVFASTAEINDLNKASIDGGEGYDTLQIDTTQNVTITVAMSGIEKIVLGSGNDLLSLSAETTAAIAIDGGAGNDTVSGTNGADLLSLSGVETVNGNDGDDGITITDGALKYADLGSGTDTLVLDSASTLTVRNVEHITGSSDVDTITVAAGNSTIDGGSGSDTVVFGNASGGQMLHVHNVESVSGGSGSDTLVLDSPSTLTISNVETVYGGSGDDHITVSGSTAAYIVGGGGYDSLVGGSGDDTFVFTSMDELLTATIYGGDGNDTILITGTDQTLTDADLANIHGIEKIVFTGGSNSITIGTQAVDEGLASIVGGTGNDTLTLADGSAYTLSLTGIETVQGGDGNDHLTVTDNQLQYANLGTGNDSLSLTGAASTATITILGGEGNDVVTGSTGNDLLNISGVETVSGGAGNDTVILADGGQTSTLTSIETVSGGSGNDSLTITDGSLKSANLGSDRRETAL